MLDEPTQYQLQASHELHMTDTFNWHQQPTSDSHMMSNQSYQMPAAATEPAPTAYLTNADQLSMMYTGPASNQLLQQHQPQISPQMNVVGNNYMGQQQPGMQGAAAIIVKPAGALSGDDNDALNDPNVSHPILLFFFFLLHCFHPEKLLCVFRKIEKMLKLSLEKVA
jgi:hypothetical protein